MEYKFGINQRLEFTKSSLPFRILTFLTPCASQLNLGHLQEYDSSALVASGPETIIADNEVLGRGAERCGIGSMRY